ncbi:aminoglycoside phosphotransferase family protein [Microlunatus flavus]|uniref:aminoglycoside phosphotransferase family protein n=1 Tax=Microlunatus flavus TaxID=1036181 RepID=UPI001E4FFBB0|nr:aminoglycoside phosphotransferase family protein [Microlunatus flavus]
MRRAKVAAVSVAAALGLPADDAVVLFSSNKLALRLTPGDVLARVTDGGLREDAALELHRARRLADAGCPVGALLPGVAPQVHERDGFAVTLWTYYDPATHPVSPRAYADALVRLHAGLRKVDLGAPGMDDRIAEAQEIAARTDLSPDLGKADRELLRSRLADLRRSITSSGAPEQLLHGEPHPGNVLGTAHGPVFIDFETLCRGPVEFDLAHVPEAVSEHYPGIDHELLAHCRQLVLAMIAAWRWDFGDQFPNRGYWRHALLRALREGLSWPAPPGTVPGRLEAP